MLEHGLKFLWLSKITTRFCQHCGGSKWCQNRLKKLALKWWRAAAVRDTQLGWPVLQPGMATATSEPCPAAASRPSVPSVTSLPPFRDKEVWRWGRTWYRLMGKRQAGGAEGLWHWRAEIDSLALDVSRDNNLYSSVSSWAFSGHFPQLFL